MRLEKYSRALRPESVGPFTIVEMIRPTAAELDLLPPWLVQRISRVSLFKPVNVTPSLIARTQQPLYDDGYTIDETLVHRQQIKDDRVFREFHVLRLAGTTAVAPEEHLLREHLLMHPSRSASISTDWSATRSGDQKGSTLLGNLQSPA